MEKNILLQLLYFLPVLLLAFSAQFAHADTTSSYASLPVGSVVSQQSATLPSSLQDIATAQRVVYVSTDVNNTKILTSGLVIMPNVHSSHPNIVAWAHPTTGVGDNCAPSLNTSVFWPDAADQVKAYLQQGWVVAATDYQGLSTEGVHQYLIGNSEGKAVIDSVRAARNIDHSLTNQWVVSGQSQGGQASLFAGELSNTYGSGLSLVGIVSLSPVSHEEQLAPAILTSQGKGYLVMALAGLAAADSSVNIYNVLAQPAIDQLSVLNTGCFNEIISAYLNFTPMQTVVGGQIPSYILDKFAHFGNPGQEAPHAPIFFVQGTADTTIPRTLTADQQRIECTYGQPTYLQYVAGATHDTISTLSTGIVSDYISARFAGLPAPSNCQ